jgi:hypothetical protein
MNLENLGVQEMNAQEVKQVEGGINRMGNYMTQSQLKSMGDSFGDFCSGLLDGFMSCF